MASPSSSTCPSTGHAGTVSFIRLSDRRNVLLPQPLGPMSASTWLVVHLDVHVLDGDLLAVADGEPARAHLERDVLRRRHGGGGDHGQRILVPSGEASRVRRVTFA